jgi:alpha-glucosidase (family GH31 glycosyl hydrolase)
MFLSSTKGGAVFQPIFFQFPDDDEAYENIDTQFMLGDALLVSPVLSLKEDNINAYFPNANWNEFPSGRNLKDFNTTQDAGGNYFNLTGKFTSLNVHLRGGAILPYQDTTSVTRTRHLQNTKTSFYVNPDQNLSASGRVVFDDGISFDTISANKYAFTNINLQNTSLLFSSTDFDSYNNTDIYIDKVVFFRGNSYSNYKNVVAVDVGGNKLVINSAYNTTTDILTVAFNQALRIPQLRSINFS